jgi:hypothetical protein
MLDQRLIQDVKNAWRNCNSATIGFCQNVPPNKWFSKPFEPRFRSFAWEFACLTRTRYCYLKSLKANIPPLFSHQEDIPDKEVLTKMDKKEIINHLKQLSGKLLTEIEQLKSPDQINKIIWLLQHERIHHGKLMLYFSNAELKLPESFVKTWGEANFPKKD